MSGEQDPVARSISLLAVGIGFDEFVDDSLHTGHELSNLVVVEDQLARQARGSVGLLVGARTTLDHRECLVGSIVVVTEPHDPQARRIRDRFTCASVASCFLLPCSTVGAERVGGTTGWFQTQ